MHAEVDADLLDRFADPDSRTAEAAFNALSGPARRDLDRWLRAYEPDTNRRADIIQQTLLRLWNARGRFHNQGRSAWFGLLRRTAYRCLADQRESDARAGMPAADPAALDAAEAPQAAAPTAAQPGPQQTRLFDAVLDAVFLAGDRAFLYQAATMLWCGLDPHLSLEAHGRQLLAARLYYDDGVPPREILALVPAPAGAPGPTLDSLSDWLTDPGVLRHLAYDELYLSNRRLAARVLGLPEMPAESLDRALASLADPSRRTGVRPSVAPPDFTAEEASVAVWRYRYGLSAQEITERRDCPLDEAALRALCDRLAGDLPFASMMDRLMAALEREVDARSLLSAPDLWKRLAFQYRYADDLAHRDIRERCQPAAERVGYDVKLEHLNVWLSGRRLWTALARYCLDLQGSGSAAAEGEELRDAVVEEWASGTQRPGKAHAMTEQSDG